MSGADADPAIGTFGRGRQFSVDPPVGGQRGAIVVAETAALFQAPDRPIIPQTENPSSLGRSPPGAKMFDGLWRNERGSEMSLTCRDGKVSGFYVTRIGDQRVTEKRTALVGAFAGETIGFVVAWPETGSVTSWFGRYRKDSETAIEAIHTLWHLVNETVGGDPPRPSDPWESFKTQASVFEKQPIALENGPESAL